MQAASIERNNSRGRRLRVQTITSEMDGAVLIPAEVCANSFFVSRAKWYELVAAGRAPQPDVKVGSKFTRWRVSTVRNWLSSLNGVNA